MSNMSRTLKEAIKEELLTCSVCMGLFVDPQILPCLHTFCDECLQSIFQTEINTRGRHTLTCPTCRCSIQGVSYEDLNLKSNFHIKNLLETIQSSPSNESFTELYRVKEGLNLDLEQAVAFAEKNQSAYLLTHNHEMASTISDLRKQLYEQNLEHQRVMKEGIETQNKRLEKQKMEYQRIMREATKTRIKLEQDIRNQKLEHQRAMKEAIEKQNKQEENLRICKSQIEVSTTANLASQIAASQTRPNNSKEQVEELQSRTNANLINYIEESQTRTDVQTRTNTEPQDRILRSQDNMVTDPQGHISDSQANTITDLRDQISEKNQVIQDLCNVNDGLRDKYRELKNTKESLEKVVENFKNMPVLHWFVNDNAGTGVDRAQARGGWFSRWFTRYRDTEDH